MDSVGFDPVAFSGKVPLFPLPNVVLFPYGILPLHIFEPRYREMTRAALKGERLIAMALLKSGWEDGYLGNPPVHPIVGIGRVVEEVKLEDGRFNLVLCGVARAEIVEVLSEEPYRTARVRILDDRPAKGKGFERKRKLLLHFYTQAISDLVQKTGIWPPEDLPLGPLCDLLASLLKLKTDVKRELLEELDSGVRCNRLLGLLGRAGAPDLAVQPAAAPWPPPSSLN